MNPDIAPEEVDALVEQLNREWYERAGAPRLDDVEVRESA